MMPNMVEAVTIIVLPLFRVVQNEIALGVV
jgi:hypothetical protein